MVVFLISFDSFGTENERSVTEFVEYQANKSVNFDQFLNSIHII